MNISNELIQKLIDVQAAYAAKEAIAIPDDAPRFEIDMDTRAITVPTGRTVLAVRNDHCAEIVCFELDRYYKGHDLSTETCVVQYAVASRRGGQYINEGFYPVTMIDLSTEGKLLFAWEIKNSVTNTSGIVDFSVRFYSIDSSGEKPEFEYNANTLISSMVIKNTLDVANEGVSFEPGEVESLTDKFEDLAKAAADSASNANKAAATIIGTLDTVKEYADAVEQNKLATDTFAAQAATSAKNASNAEQSAIDAKNSAEESANKASELLDNIKAEHTKSVSDINEAKSSSLSAIDSAKQKASKEVSDSTANAVQAAKDAEQSKDLAQEILNSTIAEKNAAVDKITSDKRDASGHAYPTAIEHLSDNYRKAGTVDVGVIQMTPYVKWDDSNPDYILWSITDSPRDGYTPWAAAKVGDTVYPYVIHSKFFSGVGEDGLLRSVYDLVPARNQSHNSLITDYAKKGPGYKGAGGEKVAWQILFNSIKCVVKSSQEKYAGCTGYNLQYPAAVQRSEKLTYFPVTKAQADQLVVGSRVSVGYGSKGSNGTVNNDRGVTTIHNYADSAKILKIEPIDDTTSAVYLDCDAFDTMPVALTDTLNAPITLTTMHWHSGTTDAVIGHHDGSPTSNTDSKHPYRVQGIEYAVGGYEVLSDMVLAFDDSNGKDVYVCPAGVAHTNTDAEILAKYKKVGNFPAGDWWIGDIGFDPETCVTWPAAKGSGNKTGTGDMVYGGGNANKNTMREYLQGGSLWDWSNAGASFVSCRVWVGHGYWTCLAAD